MADFNTPQKLSSGKWIYQGTEYDKNPLAKTATKTKTKKKKNIDLDDAIKSDKKRRDIFSGDIGGLARAIANL